MATRTYNTTTPIADDSIKNCALFRLTLDSRYRAEKMPITVTVAFGGRTYYFPTGYKVTAEDYINILNAERGTGKYISIKRDVKEYFGMVKEEAVKLAEDGRLSNQNLRDAIRERFGIVKKEEVKTLQTHWRAIAESKVKRKTQDQYITSMRSFFKYIGCKVTFTDASEDKPECTKTRAFTITGRKSNITPEEVTEEMIKGWPKAMADGSYDDRPKSKSTISVYMRALRAVLYQLRDEEKVIKKVPKMKIESGGSRKEDHLRVPDIVKVRDYQGKEKEAADWWIILYLCNGCNMKDLAQLTWGHDYFNDKELSFIRSKTEGKAPVLVHIPVTDYLQPYLEKYASKPEVGKRVFPQILSDGEHTDTQINNAVHRYNMIIRKGMAIVCEALGIHQDKPITASTARNSYITTLTWHQVSDAFIDSMVGHADGEKVIRRYQGTISPKKRAKVNGLLFVDPESED